MCTSERRFCTPERANGRYTPEMREGMTVTMMILGRVGGAGSALVLECTIVGTERHLDDGRIPVATVAHAVASHNEEADSGHAREEEEEVRAQSHHFSSKGLISRHGKSGGRMKERYGRQSIRGAGRSPGNRRRPPGTIVVTSAHQSPPATPPRPRRKDGGPGRPSARRRARRWSCSPAGCVQTEWTDGSARTSAIRSAPSDSGTGGGAAATAPVAEM